jgi:exodeoxyribonuclease V gamma subunit
MTPTHQTALQPGFLAFHSNRSEDLAEVVINWMRRHPLSPLEEEIVLVQSNGMAEWVKMELARMGGRELLNSLRKRQPFRQGRDLSALPLEDMHAHAHPLLAAWGRQGRDFIRQLDVFDDAQQSKQQFDLPRIDLFDDTPEDEHTPLLKQVQNRIRDLVSLSDLEHTPMPLASSDQSIVFHSAHSKVRELEILHDQLLHLLAAPAQNTALSPREVIVMVPDIEQMAPAIRAVFGQYKRHDKRFIPFDIADMSAKTSSPLIGAMDWLLQLPHKRCCMSELVDLLEVPAIASRFGIDPDSLPRLTQWMEGAGADWPCVSACTRLGLRLERP